MRAEDRAAAEARAEEPPAATHSGRLLVRMPQSLHAELAREAEREGVSLNTFITGVLSAATAWRAPGVGGPGPQPRPLRLALLANFVLVAVAAILAIVLLVVALV